MKLRSIGYLTLPAACPLDDWERGNWKGKIRQRLSRWGAFRRNLTASLRRVGGCRR